MRRGVPSATRRATVGGFVVCVVAGVLAAFVLSPAAAFIPESGTIARAAAKTNRDAKRNQVLAFDVSVRPTAAETVQATGTLLASPDGRARLQVRHTLGFEERQLRQRGAVQGARDGQRLTRPHPLLPPVWVLQARSGNGLLALLAELGGDPNQAAMGYDGAHDCYVLGRRDGVSFWVDQDTLALVRVDLPGGVIYRFGPDQGPEKGLRVPAWFEVEAPGLAPMRLDVTGVRAAAAPEGAFLADWLTAGN